MNRRRLTLLIAAAALAALVASAVPAFGSDAVAPRLDRRASAGALAKARQALRLSRGARRTARAARRAANRAGERVGEARGQANAALALADENRSQLNGQRTRLDAAEAKLAALEAKLAASAGAVVSDSASGLVTTTAPFGEYEQLGGPSVRVTVPDSGLIEVWATAEIGAEEGGAIGLYEDGRKVTGISEPVGCGTTGEEDGSGLIDFQGGGEPGEFVAAATPPVPGSYLGCASAGAPAAVLLSRPAGTHSYELRYSECSCNPGGGAEFRDRVLRVAPRP